MKLSTKTAIATVVLLAGCRSHREIAIHGCDLACDSSHGTTEDVDPECFKACIAAAFANRATEPDHAP